MITPQEVKEISIKKYKEEERLKNQPFSVEELLLIESISKEIDDNLCNFTYSININSIIEDKYNIPLYLKNKILQHLIKSYLVNGWGIDFMWNNPNISNFRFLNENKYENYNIDDYQLVVDNYTYRLFPKDLSLSEINKLMNIDKIEPPEPPNILHKAIEKIKKMV